MWGDRRGTEPRNAKSPLRTRAVLSGVMLPIALAATAFFVTKAVSTGDLVWVVEALIAGFVAVIAGVDLAVIRSRMRSGEN